MRNLVEDTKKEGSEIIIIIIIIISSIIIIIININIPFVLEMFRSGRSEKIIYSSLAGNTT